MNTSQGRFQTNSMLCSSCGKYCQTQCLQLDLSKYGIEGAIARLDCTVCNNFIAIKFDENLLKIDEVLEDENKNDWHEAKTKKEKIIYYILSQIIYPERDTPDVNKFESVYDFADESDLIMLRWKNGVAIGFYTLKPKGTKIFGANDHQEYKMPTLDTAYVRSEYRNHGIGTEILLNITKKFPDEDIGFSFPISDGMCKVLKKFLTTHKNYRLKFWEIENGGDEGNKKLIWFTLNVEKKITSINLCN